MSPDGTGPDPGPEPPTRHILDHVNAATRPVGDALRSLRRVRLLRGILLGLAGVLLLAVLWSIWSHRPRRKNQAAAPASTQAENALQSLDKFEYKATDKGKLLYRILADKLVGVAGGLHTLQGIRSAEITLSDGRILRGRADHGTLMEGPKDDQGAGGNGHVVLEGHVTVESDAGERLESDRIDYFQAESKLVSPGRCTFKLAPATTGTSRIGPSSGESGSAEYELTTKTIRMAGGVVLHLASEDSPETTATASQAVLSSDGTHADLQGNARVSRGEEFLTAPSIQVERSENGDRTHVVAGPGARGRFVPSTAGRPAASDPRSSARPTLIAAKSLDAIEVATTGERTVTLKGEASIEDAPVPGRPAGRSMSARTIVVREGATPAATTSGAPPAARGSRTLHAEEDVRVSFPPAEGETDRRVLTCRTLDAVAAPDGSLTTADADGSVTVRSGPRRASSARAHMVGETRAELRGGRPVVEDPDRRIVADEIDLEQKPSKLTARGSVQTRFVPAARAKQSSAAERASSALPFAPGVPVDVLSDTALLKEDEKTADFTGHVRARQSDRALSTAKLFVNDADKTAHAEGSVTVRTFREDSVPASAATVRVPVQVDADALFHDDTHRITRFEGHVVYREPGRRLTADRITLEGGTSGSPSTTLAEGHVVYDGEGKHGTGDAARHISADKTVTLEGHDRPAEVREAASGRSWRGPSLTWVQSPDSIPVVTGTSGRSRIVGSTSSQRDEVGKPTDRGKPR